jgi:hypothetical protein
LFFGLFRISLSLFPIARPNFLPDFVMRVPKHPTNIRRMLDARLAALASDQPILAASLVQIRKHCGRSCCHCRQGGELHSAHQLTYKVQGKSRTVYVPHDLLDSVRSWIANHKHHKALLAEINQLTLALVRTHATHQKRQAGRV